MWEKPHHARENLQAILTGIRDTMCELPLNDRERVGHYGMAESAKTLIPD